MHAGKIHTRYPLKIATKYVLIFYFLVEALLLLLLRAAAAAHNISTQAERGKVYRFIFWRLRCCCSSLIERDVLKEIGLVSSFCFIRVRNQSRSV